MTNIRTKISEYVCLHEFGLVFVEITKIVLILIPEPALVFLKAREFRTLYDPKTILKHSFRRLMLLSDSSNDEAMNMVNPLDLQHSSKVAVTRLILQNSLTNFCPDKKHRRQILLA